jgi:HEAT repeat protein
MKAIEFSAGADGLPPTCRGGARSARPKRLGFFLLALFGLFVAPAGAVPGPHKSLKVLFNELQEDATTDNALRQFLQRSPNDLGVKKFLSQHLPPVLDQPPKSYETYVNSVQLAGNFKIAAAIPALIKVITGASINGSTLAERERLDSFPCAKALVQIGEPSIPALSEALDGPSSEKHWFAYRALYLIGSPAAISALRDHVNREPDPTLKSEIEADLNRLPQANLHYE